MPKKLKAKSHSKILKHIIACLNEHKFPHVLHWVNRTEKIFVIKFIHKNNPKWHIRDLDLFKDLDGLSKKKLQVYLKKPDYESACKVRCKSNLKKLCSEGVLSVCKKKYEEKSKFQVYYKINDTSGIYLKEPEEAKIGIVLNMDFPYFEDGSIENLLTSKKIENDFHVEKSIPDVENPVNEHGVAEYANCKNINGVLAENVFLDKIVSHEYAGNVSEYADWKDIKPDFIQNSSSDENFTSEEGSRLLDDFLRTSASLNSNTPDSFLESVINEDSYSFVAMNDSKIDQLGDPNNSLNLNNMMMDICDFPVINDMKGKELQSILEEYDRGLTKEDIFLCCGKRLCTCNSYQEMDELFNWKFFL